MSRRRLRAPPARVQLELAATRLDDEAVRPLRLRVEDAVERLAGSPALERGCERDAGLDDLRDAQPAPLAGEDVLDRLLRVHVREAPSDRRAPVARITSSIAIVVSRDNTADIDRPDIYPRRHMPTIRELEEALAKRPPDDG